MGKQSTGIVCPGCGNVVQFEGGMAGNLVLAVVRAQAAHRGVEITCDKCGDTFLYSFPVSRVDLGADDEDDALDSVPAPHISTTDASVAQTPAQSPPQTLPPAAADRQNQ